MKRKHTGVKKFEPAEEFIIAVYERARLDVVNGRGSIRRKAEWFLRAEGFDPEKIRQAWKDKEKP